MSAVLRHLGYVLAVVRPHEMVEARKVFPQGILLASTEGHGAPLVGYRVHLLLRTTPHPAPSTRLDPLEMQVASRLTKNARIVVGDLGSLVAILGAIQKTAPWILEGSPARPV